MIPAHAPVQRPPDARLLVLDSAGRIRHAPRSRFVGLLQPGDLVVANDAATLPASLPGVHRPSGKPIEVRLAARPSLAPRDVAMFAAVVFGAGDFRIPTEARPLPPPLVPGDPLDLGPLAGTVTRLLGHPRLIALQFDAPPEEVWAGLARHGRPIQYAYVREPLSLWDVWTPVAGLPAAFEPPSAGFVLAWASLDEMRARGVDFVTLTHAAGISSTGDPELDRRLPFAEPYLIPERTAAAVRRTRAAGGRVVAIGTTVVRALEHAATGRGTVQAGAGVANQLIGPSTVLRAVDAILSGTHERDSSHYQVLRAFAGDRALAAASAELDAQGYRTHEFGDSIFVERATRRPHDAPVRLEDCALAAISDQGLGMDADGDGDEVWG